MSPSIISHHGYKQLKLLAGEIKGSGLVTAAVAVGQKAVACLTTTH
jgi:hypothetical protein